MPYFYRLVDVGIIVLAAYLAAVIRFANGEPLPIYYSQLVIFSCALFIPISSPAYRSWRGVEFLASVISISKIWLVACGLILLGLFFTKTGALFSRVWLVTWCILSYAGLVLVRSLITTILRHLRLQNLNVKLIVIIGLGPLAAEMAKRIEMNRASGFLLSNQIDHNDINSIEALHQKALDEIWISLPLTEAGCLEKILLALNNCTASIKFIPDLFTFRLINHGASEVLGMPMLDLTASPFIGINLLIKALEDIVLSSLILILISPILLLTALGIKLTSPGPILYRQRRMGINGNAFYMLKFRSMPVETEKNGAIWGGSDSKVSHPFSKFIRKYNIDELPQFLNVLRGDMSIVGPRPERIEFISNFSEKFPHYMKKHLVKAGITGWAQVHGLRGDTDIKTRIEYDLFYIENWSIWLDLKIIVMTAIQSIFQLKTGVFK